MELADRAAVREPLLVRSRRDGDRFRPLGADRESRLGHYLQRRGVPDHARDRVPLLCDAEGILWVVGHGLAHRTRVTDDTAEVAVLRLREI